MTVTFRNFQRIHLVGIGGSGMSGIAEVLLTSGYAVSGSDQKLSPVTERLRKLGVAVFEGHEPAHVSGAHVVVISSAVKPCTGKLATPKLPVIKCSCSIGSVESHNRRRSARASTSSRWSITSIPAGRPPTLPGSRIRRNHRGRRVG